MPQAQPQKEKEKKRKVALPDITAEAASAVAGDGIIVQEIEGHSGLTLF